MAKRSFNGRGADWVLRTALTLCALLIDSASSSALADGRAKLEQWASDYAIERPWQEPSEMSVDQLRYRGAVAHVSERLERGALPAPELEHFFSDLDALLELADNEAVLSAEPKFSDYQAHFQIDVHRLWKGLITDKKIPELWGEKFREAYFSVIGGHGVTFEVRLPPPPIETQDGTQVQKLPLVVGLNGSLRVSPSGEFPFIEIRPSGGRIWGYRAMSAYDVMRALDFMKKYYPIDADRIYLVGSSAGGSGAMQLASLHSDEFAAVMPLVAAGTAYSLINFKHLPVAFHHGTDDWTSSICNARVQTQRMEALDCPVQHIEYPGVGHSVPLPHEPLLEWLFEQGREPSPRSIAHECEAPSDGRSHWLTIEKFRDPHRRAKVEASVVERGDKTAVTITEENVQAISLDRQQMPQGVNTIEVGGVEFVIEGPEASSIELHLRDAQWQIGADGSENDLRPYQAGAAANLFQGEPLLIVYGTGNGRTKSLRAAAEKMAACGGLPDYAMGQHFTVVADVDLSAEQAVNCNLILVGTAEDNSVAAAILPELPISIRDGELGAGDRSPYSLEGQVMSLIYPHPQHSKRLVYWVAPFTDDDGLERFAQRAPFFLVGSDGFHRISQADLCVQTLKLHVGRQMQLGKNWQWISQPGSENAMTAKFGGADRSELSRAFMRVMLRKSSADFALWWGPSDKGMWGLDLNYLPRYDSGAGRFTEADFRTRRHADDTSLGSVSGGELKEIWQRWGDNEEILFEPIISVDDIDDGKLYRLNFPADLYIKLGQRKKVLTDPMPGPSVLPEEVMAEIFK